MHSLYDCLLIADTSIATDYVRELHLANDPWWYCIGLTCFTHWHNYLPTTVGILVGRAIIVLVNVTSFVTVTTKKCKMNNNSYTVDSVEHLYDYTLCICCFCGTLLERASSCRIGNAGLQFIGRVTWENKHTCHAVEEVLETTRSYSSTL